MQLTQEWVQAQLPELPQTGPAGCTAVARTGSCKMAAVFSLKLYAFGEAVGRLLALTLACIRQIAWKICVAQAWQCTIAADCCCSAASNGQHVAPRF